MWVLALPCDSSVWVLVPLAAWRSTRTRSPPCSALKVTKCDCLDCCIRTSPCGMMAMVAGWDGNDNGFRDGQPASHIWPTAGQIWGTKSFQSVCQLLATGPASHIWPTTGQIWGTNHFNQSANSWSPVPPPTSGQQQARYGAPITSIGQPKVGYQPQISFSGILIECYSDVNTR
jgi:hypothetical protein